MGIDDLLFLAGLSSWFWQSEFDQNWSFAYSTPEQKGTLEQAEDPKQQEELE